MTPVPTERPPRPNTSWVWVPADLVATYYGLPARVSAAMIVRDEGLI